MPQHSEKRISPAWSLFGCLLCAVGFLVFGLGLLGMFTGSVLEAAVGAILGANLMLCGVAMHFRYLIASALTRSG